MMLITWLLANIGLSPDCYVKASAAYAAYRAHELAVDEGDYVNIITFGMHLAKCFPTVRTFVKRTKGHSATSLYKGAYLVPVIDWTFNMHSPLNIPEKCTITHSSNPDVLIITIPTGYTLNGHEVKKVISFTVDGTWQLTVADEKIDLSCMGLSDCCSTKMLSLLIGVVDSMQLCIGKDRPHVVHVTTNILDTWEIYGEDGIRKSVRRRDCLRLLPFSSKQQQCPKCQRIWWPKRQGHSQKPSPNNENCDLKKPMHTLLQEHPSPLTKLITEH